MVSGMGRCGVMAVHSRTLRGDYSKSSPCVRVDKSATSVGY